MAYLTTKKRNNLPSGKFGLVYKEKDKSGATKTVRKYPMPDKNHARNAKARASEEFNKGNLTASQKGKIDAMADKVIGDTMRSAKKRALKKVYG